MRSHSESVVGVGFEPDTFYSAERLPKAVLLHRTDRNTTNKAFLGLSLESEVISVPAEALTIRSFLSLLY